MKIRIWCLGAARRLLTAPQKRMGQIQRTNLILFTYDCYHWLWMYIMMEQQQWGWLSSVSTGFHFYSGLFCAESEIQGFDLNSGFRLVLCLNIGKGCYHRQPLHYLCCCLLWISHAAFCVRKIKVKMYWVVLVVMLVNTTVLLCTEVNWCW